MKKLTSVTCHFMVSRASENAALIIMTLYAHTEFHNLIHYAECRSSESRYAECFYLTYNYK